MLGEISEGDGGDSNFSTRKFGLACLAWLMASTKLPNCPCNIYGITVRPLCTCEYC